MATINGTAGNDTLVGTASTDIISGLGGNDLLQGSGGNDSVLGGAGNDTVRGNDGTDWVEGGAGNDSIGGGGGQDSFVFREAGSTNADVFNDFSSGWDNIRLDAAFFTTLGAAGQFTSGDARFWSSSSGTAHDADDRIIYNTTTRQLWYDADGNGSEAALLIGTLNTGATVIATDIRVFGAPPSGSGQTINGTAGNDSLIGGSGNDTINGFAGEDTINGGAGADSMVGGAHPDTYFVDNPGDVIVELEDGGFDTVNASVSYTLAAWVNHLTLTGSAAINGTGNELPNDITGNSGANILNGLASDDTLVGLSGDDVLDGGPGADSMDGGLGNDTYVTDGSDSVTDAGGIDTIIVEGGGGTLPSGSGIENLTIRGYEAHPEAADATGNELNNVIRDEGPGRSFINGQGGNDTLIGSAGSQNFSFSGNYTPGVGYAEDYGHDVVDGGGGNDFLFFEGNPVAVTVDFRNGTVTGGSPVAASVTFTNVRGAIGTLLGDVMFASNSGNDLWGYGGDDTLTGGAGADRIVGDDGLDHPTSSFGNDRLLGGGGNDVISGQEGDDWIDGGAGNDDLGGDNVSGVRPVWRDSFAFTVAPGAANADTIDDFLPAEDRIVLDGAVHANSGPSGTFAAGDARFAANSTGTAQDATDRVIYNTQSGQLWYDVDGNGAAGRQLIATLLGAPTLAAPNIEVINGSGSGGGGGGGGSTINGTSGNDTLTGTAGNDTINGLGGNDLFMVGSTGGADVIDGGTGTDSIEFRFRATSGVVVDFGAGTITGGSSGTISFTAVERVVASNFADSLTGAAGGQTLTGQGGADTLWGGLGVDTLWGAGGNDAFVFREMGSANADRVSDFASGADKLQLDDAAFTSIGAMGNFAAGDARFWASSSGAAHDSNDRVLYNTSTGQLYYDADGTGGGTAQLIATISGAPGVAATDIAVI